MTTYRLYRNVTRPFEPYQPGDKLWFDATAYEVDAEGDAALNIIFDRHNRDDRPDGQLAPSLSVGDLIALDFDNENLTVHGVAPYGFEQHEGPMLTQVVNIGPEYNLPGTIGEDATWSEAMDATEGLRLALRRG